MSIDERPSESFFLTTGDERLLNQHGAHPEGFIERFAAWGAERTDASRYALHAGALVALSLAAGDVVVLPAFFGRPLHLNIYALLLGSSTTVRKSTVMALVRDVLPFITANGQDAPLVQYQSDFSLQSLGRDLATAAQIKQPTLIDVDEVAGLFQMARQHTHYLRGLDKVLLESYDHSPIRISRAGARPIDVPNGAFVSLLVASTPEPLLKVLSPDDMASGLLPRFLLFNMQDAQGGNRRSFTERLMSAPEWVAQKLILRGQLAEIAATRLNGPQVPTSGTQPEAELERLRATLEGLGFEGRRLEMLMSEASRRSGQAGAELAAELEWPVTELQFTAPALSRLDELDEALYDDRPREDGSISTIKGRAQGNVLKVAGLYKLSRAGLAGPIELLDVVRALDLVGETAKDLLDMHDNLDEGPRARVLGHVETALHRRGLRGIRSAGYLQLTKKQRGLVVETFRGGVREALELLLKEGRAVRTSDRLLHASFAAAAAAADRGTQE